jgi:hypothetical protein
MYIPLFFRKFDCTIYSWGEQFFYLGIQELHKKYLCTKLVNLSPTRILFGHIIACVQKYARIVSHPIVLVEVKNANGHLCLRGAQNVIFCQNLNFYVFYLSLSGRHILVGMATHYGLCGLRSNPGGDEILRARPDRPRVPPNLLYNGYWFITEGKAPGRGDNHISHSSTEFANRLQLYLRLPSVPAKAFYRVTFILFTLSLECLLETARLFLSVQLFVCLFVCLFSWRYNSLWLYFHSPVAGFSLLVFGVS